MKVSDILVEQQLNEFVRERNGKWVVLNHTKKKVLGTHDTKEEAEAQLRAIEANKHSE